MIKKITIGQEEITVESLQVDTEFCSDIHYCRIIDEYKKEFDLPSGNIEEYGSDMIGKTNFKIKTYDFERMMGFLQSKMKDICLIRILGYGQLRKKDRDLLRGEIGFNTPLAIQYKRVERLNGFYEKEPDKKRTHKLDLTCRPWDEIKKLGTVDGGVASAELITIVGEMEYLHSIIFGLDLMERGVDLHRGVVPLRVVGNPEFKEYVTTFCRHSYNYHDRSQGIMRMRQKYPDDEEVKEEYDLIQQNGVFLTDEEYNRSRPWNLIISKRMKDKTMFLTDLFSFK